jgi:RimJ/RimL family protein N-acetyltransferase
MKWIDDHTALNGSTVNLLPLQEEHFPALIDCAADDRIREFIPIDFSTPEKYGAVLRAALTEREFGNQFPFVILHKPTNTIIGSTRFMDIQPAHRKLEIGWTWLHPDYWATIVNPECKLLLLRHCFEVLHATRVQLRTDELNIRSRKAIAKIGAQFEGIFRHDLIRSNGTHRNSAYFSIIDTEWPDAETKIKTLINERS